MKKIIFPPLSLQILYLITFFMLFAFMVYTPTLINGPAQISEKFIIKEETIEGALLGILFLLSILILNLYKHEVYKHQKLLEKIDHEKKRFKDLLNDSDQYIGLLNVQIEEIKSIFNSLNKFPETKGDLKRIYSFLGKRVHGIVNSNWVLFRIISLDTQRTISEHLEVRQELYSGFPHVSNKRIVEEQSASPCASFISCQEDYNFLVFCVIPADRISNEQHIFIQAIINEITKFFIISNLSINKNKRLKILSA